MVTSDRIFDSVYGGEGKFSVSLCQWLINHADIVSIIGSKASSVDSLIFTKKEFTDNLNIHNTNNNNRIIYPPYYLFMLSRIVMTVQWIHKIISVNKKHPISLIHVQNTGYAGLASIIAGKILRIPVIITSHGIRHKTLEELIKGRLRKLFLKLEFRLDVLTLNLSQGVIVVNESIKKYFKNITYTEIELIYSPIKVKDYEYSEPHRLSIRNELQIPHDDVVVGFIGRLSPEKNLMTLLESFNEACVIAPQLRLVLVGAGPLEQELQEYVRKHKLKVLFLGVRPDIPKLLSSFDIFVLPSFTEGLSIALLEAMANERAIICSNIDANTELVTDRKDALIIDPSDSNSIKEAMLLLAKCQQLRLSIASNARNRVNSYDESLVFPKILEYYKKKI